MATRTEELNQQTSVELPASIRALLATPSVGMADAAIRAEKYVPTAPNKKETLSGDIKDELVGPQPGPYYGNVDPSELSEAEKRAQEQNLYDFGDDTEILGPQRETYETNEDGSTAPDSQAGSDAPLTPNGQQPGHPYADAGTYIDGANRKSQTMATEKDETKKSGPTGSYKSDLEKIYGVTMEYCQLNPKITYSNTSKKPAVENAEAESVVGECKAVGDELNNFGDIWFKKHVRTAISDTPVETSSGGYVYTVNKNHISGYTG